MADITVYPGVSGDDYWFDSSSLDNSSTTHPVNNLSFCGFRFPNVTIPAGASIISAFLRVTAGADQALGSVIRIFTDTVANPSAPTTFEEANAITMSSPIDWTEADAWVTGTQYDSDDITSLIQDLVNLPAWASGNAMQLFINRKTLGGGSNRVIQSGDIGAGGRAELHVTYTTGLLVTAQPMEAEGSLEANATRGIVSAPFSGAGFLGGDYHSYPLISLDVTSPMAAQGSLTCLVSINPLVIITAPPLIGAGSLAVGYARGENHLRATLPLLTLDADGESRSAMLRKDLPLLTLDGNILVGQVASLERNLPRITLSASGLTGQIAEASLTLPLLTLDASGWPIGVGTLEITLPLLQLLGHAQAGTPTYAVLAMNPRHFGVTEYASFPFNSFAYFNGEYLGAKSTGIHRLTGDLDNGATAIAASGTLGKVPLGETKARDVWINGRSSGAMQISIAADEGTASNFAMNFLLATLKNDRVKVPRGLKPIFLQIGFSNVSGSSFDIDSLQVTGEKIQRKKR